jgi:hypothetical protein
MTEYSLLLSVSFLIKIIDTNISKAGLFQCTHSERHWLLFKSYHAKYFKWTHPSFNMDKTIHDFREVFNKVTTTYRILKIMIRQHGCSRLFLSTLSTWVKLHKFTATIIFCSIQSLCNTRFTIVIFIIMYIFIKNKQHTVLIMT